MVLVTIGKRVTVKNSVIRCVWMRSNSNTGVKHQVIWNYAKYFLPLIFNGRVPAKDVQLLTRVFITWKVHFDKLFAILKTKLLESSSRYEFLSIAWHICKLIRPLISKNKAIELSSEYKLLSIVCRDYEDSFYGLSRSEYERIWDFAID